MKIRNLFLFAVLLAACAPAPAPTATLTLSPSATLEPSATPTRTPKPTTDWTATAQVKATDEMAYLVDSVQPDLELVGYSIDEGELGYQMEGPIEIVAELPNFRYWDFPEPFTNPVFEDFVLSLDIVWNSETGFAGCDVIFRSDGDIGDGEHAKLSTMRLSGAPSYDLTIVNFNTIYGVIARGSNMAIKQGANAVNHYVIAVQGSEVRVYVNGVRLAAGNVKESMNKGEIVFEAWQESGETTCTFSNAWVWELP